MQTSCYYFLLLIIPFLYLLVNQIANKVRNLPPSPLLSWPLIGHLHLMNKPGIFAQLADKYGPILMLHFGSRRVLLVSSPSAAEECLTKNDIIFANRPRFLTGKYLGYNYTTMVWAPYSQHWRNLRKIANVHILSSTRIQTLENIRRNEVRSTIQQLLRVCKADEFGIVDLKSTFFELALNIMMRMVAGKRQQDDDEARGFLEMIRETNLVNGSTNLVDYIPFSRWIGGRRKIERMLEKLQAKRDNFLQGLIEARKKMINRSDGENEEEKSMIDVLLSLQEEEPEYYKDEIIKGLIQVH